MSIYAPLPMSSTAPHYSLGKDPLMNVTLQLWVDISQYLSAVNSKTMSHYMIRFIKPLECPFILQINTSYNLADIVLILIWWLTASLIMWEFMFTLRVCVCMCVCVIFLFFLKLYFFKCINLLIYFYIFSIYLFKQIGKNIGILFF